MHAAATSSQNNTTSKPAGPRKKSSVRNSSKQLVDLEKGKRQHKADSCNNVPNNHAARRMSRSDSLAGARRLKEAERRKSTSNKPKIPFNSSKQFMDIEELVEEEKEQKNWKGIGIALLVIVVVFSCVSVAVVIVTPDPVIVREGRKLTMDELINGEYEPFTVEPRWMGDGQNMMYKNKDNELIFYECDSNYSTVYLDSAPYHELGASEYLASPDQSFILFRYEHKKIYEHSSLSKYKVYNTDTRFSVDLIGPHGHVFQYVRWSNIGQGLYAVQDNNVYFKESFAVPRGGYIQLTSSGLHGVVFNGVPDWLYGEVVLKRDNTIWVSPKDEYIVYLEINDTSIPEVPMASYGVPTSRYPEVLKQRFPKQGGPYPGVQLKVYSFTMNRTLTVRPPTSLINTNHYRYVTSVIWRNNISFAVVWLNQAQNVSVITICTANSAYCYENMRLEETDGWIDPPNDITFVSSTGGEYFITMSRYTGAGDSVRHVAVVDATIDIRTYKIPGRWEFLTIDEVEVVRVVSYFNHTVYFLGTPLDDPKQRHLYSATANRVASNYRNIECVTCRLDEDCEYVDAMFGPTGEYYVLACLGPRVPHFSVFMTPDIFLSTLETNEKLNGTVTDILVPLPEYVNISLPDDQYILSKVIMPPVLDKEELIQYTLVIVPNGNIGEQSVTSRYHLGWEHYLASRRDIIVVLLDTSGSRGRGDRWMHDVIRGFGERQAGEILQALRYFLSLHYVQARFGVMGKDLGGHIALSALSSDFNDIIGCGALISPLLDLSYADVFTNEKIHRTEDYNIIKDPHLLSQIHNLNGRKLLLAHGTLDDRILFQNSVHLEKALVTERIIHKFQTYPDVRDVFDDATTKHHLVSTIDNFISHCFGMNQGADPVWFDDEVEVE